MHFKTDSILVWMQANTTFWGHNAGIFLTYFTPTLFGRLSHITDLIKSDVIGQIRNMPPPFLHRLRTFDDFNRHNVVSRRKSKWLILLTLAWQWIRHVATIETLSAFIKRGQYHVLPLIVTRYEPRRRSKTSTPPMLILYSLGHCQKEHSKTALFAHKKTS